MSWHSTVQLVVARFKSISPRKGGQPWLGVVPTAPAGTLGPRSPKEGGALSSWYPSLQEGGCAGGLILHFTSHHPAVPGRRCTRTDRRRSFLCTKHMSQNWTSAGHPFPSCSPLYFLATHLLSWMLYSICALSWQLSSQWALSVFQERRGFSSF